MKDDTKEQSWMCNESLLSTETGKCSSQEELDRRGYLPETRLDTKMKCSGAALGSKITQCSDYTVCKAEVT